MSPQHRKKSVSSGMDFFSYVNLVRERNLLPLNLPVIHVAGTNGKGSVCAMLESVLRQSGYRTGLTVSPHLLNVGERIQINGVPMEEEEFWKTIGEFPDDMSFFQKVTAGALSTFVREKPDVVIMETGIGGRLDPTNAPDDQDVLLTIITSIAMDHQEILGNTREEIARDKAGIFAREKPALVSSMEPSLEKVFLREGKKKNVIPRFVPPLLPGKKTASGEEGQWVIFRGQEMKLALEGDIQRKNAALVLEAVEVLRERGWTISPQGVSDGLSQVRWPGRRDRRRVNRRSFLLDGAHNPQGIKALAQELNRENVRLSFVVSISREKNGREIMETLAPLGEKFWFPHTQNPRQEDPGRLREWTGKGREMKDVQSAISAAMEEADPSGLIVVTGSLLFLGEVIEIFQNMNPGEEDFLR